MAAPSWAKTARFGHSVVPRLQPWEGLLVEASGSEEFSIITRAKVVARMIST